MPTIGRMSSSHSEQPQLLLRRCDRRVTIVCGASSTTRDLFNRRQKKKRIPDQLDDDDGASFFFFSMIIRQAVLTSTQHLSSMGQEGSVPTLSHSHCHAEGRAVPMIIQIKRTDIRAGMIERNSVPGLIPHSPCMASPPFCFVLCC